jgi:hypothetical protein
MQKAAEVRTQQARAQLAAGDFLGAAKLAGEAARLMPGDPIVLQLVDQVAVATMQECDRRVAAKQFASALDLVRGVLAQMPQGHPRLDPALANAQAAWVTDLTAGAQAAEAAGHQADALFQDQMIAVLTRSPQVVAHCAELRQALRTQHEFVVAQKSSTSPLAARLFGAQPERWVRILAPGDKAPSARATLEFSLGKPKVATTHTSRTETQQYQSGTKQVPNPFYASKQRDVQDAERRVTEAEHEQSEAERYVQQYTQDVAREGDTPNETTGAEQNLYNANNRLEAARRSLDSARQDLQRARDELARTEQSKEEPVYSQASVTVTRHTLRATATLQGKLVPTQGAPIDIDKELVLEVSDEGHPAMAIANVAADPLELPTADQIASSLATDAMAELQAKILAAFADYRQTFRAAGDAATDPGVKVDQLVLYILLDPAAADAQVATQLYQLRGIPNAAVLLAGT